MDTKKIAATFAILMIALGTAGLAYAHWSEFVWVYGTIETGCTGLEWSFDYDLIQDKDVAYVDYYFYLDGGYLWFGIYNAYPCLEVWLYIDVHNTGDVPMRLEDYTCDWEGTDLTPWIEVLDEYWYGDDGNGDGIYGSLEQLDPCDRVWYVIGIHFMQENAAGELLPEDAWMSFWYEFEWVNWNAP